MPKISRKKRIKKIKLSTNGKNNTSPIRHRTLDELNFRQQKFVKYYVIHEDHPGIAADAAGYRRGIASAHSLLKNPKILAAIEEEKARLIEKIEIKQEQVIKELAKIALFTIDQAVEFDGRNIKVKPFRRMTPSALSSIQEIATTRNGTIKIRTHDKMSALQSLGRYFGIFDDRLKVDMGVRLQDVLSALPPELGERIRRTLAERFSGTGDKELPPPRKVIPISE